MQDGSKSLSNQSSREVSRYEIYLSPNKILRLLILLILVLATISFSFKLTDNLHLVYPYKDKLVQMFYVDAERNIPALFSVMELLADSFVLVIIAHFTKAFDRRYLWHWIGLSLIFFFLSMDEAFSFHELLVIPLHDALHIHGGLLTFTWVIVGAIFVIAFVLSYLQFTFKLPAKTRRLFITAFLLYVGGAVGLEMIGGDLADLFGFDSLPYLIQTTLEESNEMLGAAVFLYALLLYLRTQLSDREIHLCLHQK
jgi:hypothetical protein